MRHAAPVKNALTRTGKTWMGRQGKKYLVRSNGEKKATPSPPLVSASSTPCVAVTAARNSARR